MRIAVTGGLATGKSNVARMLEGLGAAKVDADEIVHEMFLPGTEVFKKLVERFGASILDSSSIIDRRKFAEIIFKDAEARRFVESIVHPHVRDEILRRMTAAADAGNAVVIVEVPLLFEVGWAGDFDAVIVTACSYENEVARCMKKFGIGEEDAKVRIASQMPLEKKVSMSDAVISTDGPHEETRREVEKLFHKLTEEMI
jgi:dephospho-CoA kinase